MQFWITLYTQLKIALDMRLQYDLKIPHLESFFTFSLTD